MAKVLGFSGRDAARIGRAVRDFESRPPSLPVADGKHVQTHSRVVMFEVVSGPTDGVYQVKILKRKPTGGYVAVSTIQVKMEDINA